ncbi:MAG: ATP-binding cassette domain-containing protein [Clostridia bacterium]
MLKLEHITKDYITAGTTVKALKGIDIEFRENEFVSILGQSGCGKTTLLNIIGGLDRYTDGNLIINGKSTKEFKDKDWDAYRNYSVGFVFQSYNLISHQTILSNVELALTLSGVSKKERKQRAIKALQDVGLGEQIHKKPNQLSGGQMQRVAIARALVNNPDIILADEPTGALDTKTSKQVMEILKEIAKDRLVIMVTHNPELAEEYSTRIIKILDGVITDDSNPYQAENVKIENTEKEKRRTSIKFFTALNLSLNNLMTKKGRTILTAFAGSIGIIGIALILAISTGIQNYIDKVEEDTLSSYPISIEEAVIDTSAMMETMMEEQDKDREIEDGKIYSQDIMSDMLSTISNKVENNNLTEFKKYLEEENNELVAKANAIQYQYNLNLNLYKENTEDGIVQVNPSTVMEKMGMGSMTQNSTQTSGISIMNTDVWTEMLDNEELLQEQYDIVAGSWPKAYNEVVLIVNDNNEINDYVLYSLGVKDQNELQEKMEKIQNGETIEDAEETTYTYDELLNLSFKLMLNSDYYQKENGLWINKKDDDTYMKEKLKDAESIKVVGIIKLNEDSVASGMSGGIGYLKDLKEHVINKTNESDIVKEQKENPEINVFTGLKFPNKGEKAEFNMNDLTTEQKLAISQMSAEEVANMMQTYKENQEADYDENLEMLGAVDLEKPSSILIYPKSFDAKEDITKLIEEYSEKQREEGKEENVITYSDIVGTMMKSITNIIDAVSYALIGFVSISLIVSSIMIGIITYISVLERTKEIGILRAIGASKKDISKVFNAETFIVGLIAGLIGIGITEILTIPINAAIKALSGVTIQATVEPVAAMILVVISMILTVIAGLIPAKMASKKDPVEALRTE